MAHLFISAAHKSSGKTTVSIGLCAALQQRGYKVQPFKKGPDYIDPIWLSMATGRTCRNLDFHLMGQHDIMALFARCGHDADLSLIEGNKGLYDGLDLDGSNSNAALAKLTEAPVVLVIDARGMTRGIAPLILGYQAFDREINIAGVILNNVGGNRHEGKLRSVIEHYTDVPVVGAVHYDKRLQILERHLGLMPGSEALEARDQIDGMGKVLAEQVDLDAILAIANSAPKPILTIFSETQATHAKKYPQPDKIRIGIARDQSFGFYYADDLEDLEQEGAELVYIDMLNDSVLPDIDGLFIGGGFPEVFMHQLEKNASMRKQVRKAIESGLPTYAECGGLMYLARSLSWRGEVAEMVGIIPGNVVMHDKPVGRGYVQLREEANDLWPAVAMPDIIHAHEFHYSSLENLEGKPHFAYTVARGYGIDGKHDGLIYKNLLASYSHLRSVGEYHWARRFARFVREKKGDS
ncbi:MAG: hydrogenobyrinic acid a,c-diamide synthase (glutamine-hydrolyzing) [Sulfuricellaceae bacterium]|nr:hydrogenobyrinic acid a,c-diamide synthase (glutamine-hydrolyzing) [Sulfuricellaceae bacterium]